MYWVSSRSQTVPSTQPYHTLQQAHCAVQDVIVKVSMASICGSDMHPYLGRGVPLDHGITFGHEYTGVIVQTGPEVCVCQRIRHQLDTATPAASQAHHDRASNVVGSTLHVSIGVTDACSYNACIV